MSLNIRRIVTGHDDQGRAKVLIDERVGNASWTIHNWINNGFEPCVIAFVLIRAKSVTAGGKLLPAEDKSPGFYRSSSG